MQPEQSPVVLTRVLTFSVLLHSAFTVEIVRKCDLPDFPSPGGFTVSLYNNSAQETLKYHPPRPFLATISFALAWNMTTHWLHSGGVGNVNISILCNNERFHWYHLNLVRNFRPHPSQLCWSRHLVQVSLPCKSKCFLAYNWKGNDVKSIGRIIGRFDTPTHEPVGGLEITSTAVRQNSVNISWQVNDTVSCCDVVDINVMLSSGHNLSKQHFSASHLLSVTLPREWTQGEDPFFFNVSLQYCTKLGCSAFSQPVLLQWTRTKEEEPVSTLDSDVAVLRNNQSVLIIALVLLVVVVMFLIAFLGILVAWICSYLKKQKKQHKKWVKEALSLNAKVAFRNKILSQEELIQFSKQFNCADSIPKDSRTECTSFSDQHSSDLQNDIIKGDNEKRSLGEGCEDSSDNDSSASFIHGSDDPSK